MSGAEYQIRYFGWYSNPAENSDKVWGFCEVEGKIYNFWGKRNGSLQFKRHHNIEYQTWYGPRIWEKAEADCRDLASAKSKKGYKEIAVSNIESVYADFHKEFKKQLATARMTGKVKSEEF